ncbi:oxidoreductase [Longispora fulva]|uniref:3-oxoacyl-[acyl-carrier protein] reductase n=1 Tax=Longispora fulva TaxID=619741 RepID=A0A8J7GNY1_9ACTN|nr:SDR family oxidoreductase [Longispora fulva]MBG6141340.1 3-oxoacyl-[acyl-carrier protein] reductase [Longispora fulva]GIG59510.1 oxidoreductase [Longispora fulva]
MDLGLRDRVYVITGGSRGLGFATAQALVADGAKVVLSSRGAGKLEEAVGALGANAVGVPADLADPGTPDLLLTTAVEQFGRVDGVLVSVGGPARGTAAGTGDDAWRDAFETVFLGAVRMARAAARQLTSGGVIGFVLSSSAREPIDGLGISNGLRPGLAGVAKDMAREYGPHGVRVLSLLPGRIMTERNQELLAATGDAARAEEEARAAIPLRRLGAPHEFGAVAAFLLSPAASYVSGVTVPVDGGALRGL